MKKITDIVLEKMGERDINITDNYKIYRVLEKIINPTIFNKDKYQDFYLTINKEQTRIRIVNPFEDNNKKNIIIYIHGGGWVLGSVESYTNTCVNIAKMTDSIVLLLDYHLAPEYPYPRGFDDCYNIIKALSNHAKELAIDKEKLILMGDSAGANLCAAISLKARDTSDFRIYKQMLLYPVLQTDFSENTKYKSIIKNGEKYFLTRKSLVDYMKLYISDEKDLVNPYVGPIYAKDFTNQPKTLIITCDKDPLRDEGYEYASILKANGNYTEYYNLKNTMHGFLTQNINKKSINNAYMRIRKFVGDKYE